MHKMKIKTESSQENGKKIYLPPDEINDIEVLETEDFPFCSFLQILRNLLKTQASS